MIWPISEKRAFYLIVKGHHSLCSTLPYKTRFRFFFTTNSQALQVEKYFSPEDFDFVLCN